MANKSNDKEMDTGFIYLSRKIMTHPSFMKKPFDEFHALVWLLLNARYSDSKTTQYVGEKLCTWGRGEVPASLRFLEEAFGWPKTNVERWIKKLVDNGTVERRQTQAGTVLRVINYETYQKPGQKTGRKAGQQQGQQNPLPARDTDEHRDSNWDTNRDSNRDEGGTLAGHSRDKTVSKEEIQVVNKEEKKEREVNSHSQVVKNNIKEENFIEEEIEIIKKFRKAIEIKYPRILDMNVPFTGKQILELKEKYSADILNHYFQIMENDANLKKHNAALGRFNKLLECEKDESWIRIIKNANKKYEAKEDEKNKKQDIIDALGNEFWKKWKEYLEQIREKLWLGRYSTFADEYHAIGGIWNASRESKEVSLMILNECLKLEKSVVEICDKWRVKQPQLKVV